MSSWAQVHTVASRPTLSQQPRPQGLQGAGSQAHWMGARVSQVLQGIHVGAELLSPSLTRRAEMLPPLGFNFNRGANYVPCIIIDNRGRGIPARYTRVVMGSDPQVVGIIPGDCNQYGGPLYTIPDHNQSKHPRYTYNDLWWFKYSADDTGQFDTASEFLHDLSLTTEVTCFHECSHLFFQYQEEICKLEEHMWEAGQLKDTSACRLEGANALHRIEEAVTNQGIGPRWTDTEPPCYKGNKRRTCPFGFPTG